MMREPNLPEDAQVVTIDIGIEVYLRYRVDPLNILGTFQFNVEHLDETDLLESFMGIVVHTYKDVMNSRDEGRFTFSDSLSNKFSIETAEIQAISWLAPSIETITAAVEESKNG